MIRKFLLYRPFWQSFKADLEGLPSTLVTRIGVLIQCPILSKSTILVLAAPSVFELAPMMSWRWFPGMVVKLNKLPPPPEPKTV